jgi:hypothetical protein
MSNRWDGRAQIRKGPILPVSAIALALLTAACGGITAATPTPSPTMAIAPTPSPTMAIAPTPSPTMAIAPTPIPSPTGILSSTLGGLESISCPSASDCVAVGGVAGSAVTYFTTNGGASWSPGTLPASQPPLLAVSCPSTQVCVAVGGTTTDRSTPADTLHSGDGGSSWSAGTLPSGLNALGTISCASASYCVAGGIGMPGFPGGVVAVTRDGGVTWSRGSLPNSASVLGALSCPSPSRCVAVSLDPQGQQTRLSTDGGISWRTIAIPQDTEPDNDSDDAWATTSLPGSRVNGGPGVVVHSLSCPNSSRCVVVGSGTTQTGQGITLALYSTNSGASWRETTLPTSAGYQLFAVTCPSANNCVAVGSLGADETRGAALFSHDGGVTWTLGTVPATAGNLASLSCSSVADCVAVVGAAGGQAGNPPNAPGGVFFTHDGGASWS